MEQNFGLISIIMAAYNAENTIEKAVMSVIAQTYTQFELIIINDCSTDKTLSIIKKFEAFDKRIFLINNPYNRGVSYTRRYGLELCSRRLRCDLFQCVEEKNLHCVGNECGTFRDCSGA